MRAIRTDLRRGVIWVIAVILTGCSDHVPAVMESSSDLTDPIVMGRVMVVTTGESSRRYEPRIRFIEIENRQTDQRFTVDIDAQDTQFALPLPAGDYQVNRVQISEGPFMSMADIASFFSIGTERITYVGTWRFGIDSPRYGRMVVVSMVLDDDGRSRVRDFLIEEYPQLANQPMVEVLPQQSHSEARLYEVMPYPRYPRYFRRHWW